MSNQNQNFTPSAGDLKPDHRVIRRLLLLAALPVILFIASWALGGFLVFGDRLQRADAVILLSGGDEARLGEAVRIFQSGLASQFVITETGTIPDGGGPRASSLLAEQAVAAGVPWENIATTLGKSASTRDEAAAVRDFAERDGLKSIIVVTDPYHTRRTQYVFHAVFSGSGIRVMVRPVRAHWYQSATWFFSRRGWEVTVKEYLKLAATVMGIQGD